MVVLELAGIGAVMGVAGLLMVVGTRNAGSAASRPDEAIGSISATGAPTARGPRDGPPSGGWTRMAAAAATALAVGVVTRWPVAALLAGLATWGLPFLMASTSGRGGIERTESIAVWTELLRDTLAAAAGLSQAIVTTAELSPRSIRAQVLDLAERLVGGIPMEDAFRSFADELADPSADLVVCALLLAASARSQRLADLLGALAASCREQVSMRLRVEASRASSRSSVRTIVVFSLAFAGLLSVFAHNYLAPFGTATGQGLLLVVGACYVAGLLLMVRLVRERPMTRLLGTARAR